MFGIARKGIKAHNPTITFNGKSKAPLSRRVERAKRLKISIDRAVARGDANRAGRLQEEYDQITRDLVAEQDAVKELLAEQA